MRGSVRSLAVLRDLLVDKRNSVHEDHTLATDPTQPAHIPVLIYFPAKEIPVWELWI